MIRTPYELANRFLGVQEIEGALHNPAIMAMLTLDNEWPKTDETPWCAAFVNYVLYLAAVERSTSLRARSYLKIGVSVPLVNASAGWDIAVLTRGTPPQEGPEVIDAPGHVGFVAAVDHSTHQIHLLGGNQGDRVSIAPFSIGRVLDVRRVGAPQL